MSLTFQANPVDDRDKKLGELILYISQKSASDLYYGSTKLNKILYFSDFLSYRNWDDPVTGVEYFHLPQGPAPRRLLPVRKYLIDSGWLQLQVIQFPDGKIQHKPVNLREPNLDLFKARHISLVDSVIEALQGLNATEISNFSHLEVGWQITRKGETIPYPMVFLSTKLLTPPDQKRAEEVIREEERRAVA
jgi:hypothetical protein